uniref:Uncharacterized protein n=1 Tax=Loa loa TaxID=7209 RepID=A0A1I7VE60_LOALO
MSGNLDLHNGQSRSSQSASLRETEGVEGTRCLQCQGDWFLRSLFGAYVADKLHYAPAISP